MTGGLSTLTHRDADWAGLRVLVAGLGVSGFAAADALLERGAQVTVVDGVRPAEGSAMAERAWPRTWSRALPLARPGLPGRLARGASPSRSL